MRQGRITIEDVASAAGVSRQTVSRVINDSPRVSPAAKARVEQAIAALGYVPSLAARSMGGGRSRLVLAVFEGPPPGARPALPLDRLLLAGTAACRARGCRLMFEQLASGQPAADGKAQLAATLGAVQPDGMILLPPLGSRADLRALAEARGIAADSLDGPQGAAGNPGEAAAQHLIALGHRQVGFIAGATDPQVSQQNLAGYRRALARSGSRAHRHFAAANAPDLPALLDLAQSWLVPTIRPTAIIAERAQTALAVLHVARTLGLAVPRELSLLALEDDPALMRGQPPVTALHEPTAPLFAAACERLMAARDADGEPADEDAQDGSARAVLALPLTLELVERASLARAPRRA